MEVHGSPVSVVGARSSLSNPSAVAANQDSAADHMSGQGEEAIKDIVCGSVAGVVGKYIEYPFDTVKVRLQSQPDSVPLRYTGPLDCFKKSLQRDGFIGIYRGISAPLLGAAVETSTLFFSASIHDM
jgi:ornithine carrier protein